MENDLWMIKNIFAHDVKNEQYKVIIRELQKYISGKEPICESLEGFKKKFGQKNEH